MSCLNVVVPDLFGTFPTLLVRGTTRPSPYVAEILLGRADALVFAGTHLNEVLFQLFGGRRELAEDVPSGAVSRLADIGGDADGWWMRADPVFLRPDGDRLLLFDGHGLDIQPAEAEQLAALFNTHYREHGWRLEIGHPVRWYLRLPSDPKLRTYPLSQVVGRNVDSFLPGSTARADLRYILNEVQMLFHDAEVNRQREARGVPPINSLWFWGAGRLPERLSANFSLVHAETPFARGLTALTGLKALPLPSKLNELVREPLAGEQLVVNPNLRRFVLNADYAGWKDALTTFDRDFMNPLYWALKKGHVRELRLFPCNGYSYRLERRFLRRFWRRRIALVN